MTESLCKGHFTLTLQHNISPSRLCVSVSPPPQSSEASLLDELPAYPNSVQFRNFIIIGNFSVVVLSDSHSVYSKLCSVISTLSLTQMVHKLTHFHYNGTASTIDLLLASNHHLIDYCSTVPTLSPTHIYKGLQLIALQIILHINKRSCCLKV